jgi:hypothetical protein
VRVDGSIANQQDGAEQKHVKHVRRTEYNEGNEHTCVSDPISSGRNSSPLYGNTSSFKFASVNNEAGSVTNREYG